MIARIDIIGIHLGNVFECRCLLVTVIRQHNLAVHVVVRTCIGRNDFELRVVTDVQDQLSRDVAVVYNRQRQFFLVPYSHALKVYVGFLYVDIRHDSSRLHREP